MAEHDPFAACIFCLENPVPPRRTVFYSIYPDFSLNPTSPNISSQLTSLRLEIIEAVTGYTSNYIWQHEPFTLTPFPACIPPHLSGKLRFDDNRIEEWFIVFLLSKISIRNPNVSIRVWDSRGEFLLSEAPSHLPRLINSYTAMNRVFLRNGLLHIIPSPSLPFFPSIQQALNLLGNPETIAPVQVQCCLENRLKKYPKMAEENVVSVRVRVPVSVAKVLKRKPSLISLAGEVFYDGQMANTEPPENMERFWPNGYNGKELVQVVVRMPRNWHMLLKEIPFQAPSSYSISQFAGNFRASEEANLGRKIACGFEVMYQLRNRQCNEPEGSTCDLLYSPVQTIDEILATESEDDFVDDFMDDFEDQEDDSLLYATWPPKVQLYQRTGASSTWVLV